MRPCNTCLDDRDKGLYNVGIGIPVTLEGQIRTIVDVFSPKDNHSPIAYAPKKKAVRGCLMNVDNTKEELSYGFSIKELFEQFNDEKKITRFYELRSDGSYQ